MSSKWDAQKIHARRLEKMELWQADDVQYLNNGELYFTAVDPKWNQGMYFEFTQVEDGTRVDFGQIFHAYTHAFDGEFKSLFARTLNCDLNDAIAHVSKSFNVNLSLLKRRMDARIAK